MHISILHLENFKRFTNLKIDLSSHQKPPKLVLLIGGNGSGKSCVFDAMGLFSSALRGQSKYPVINYYLKDISRGDFFIESILEENKKLSFSLKKGVNFPKLENKENSFYGRSSLRQIPFLTREALGQNALSIENDADRPEKYIYRDIRFENDLEGITESILKEFFLGEKQDNTKITAQYIDPINEAFVRIFGKSEQTSLSLTTLIPPLDNKVAQILFKKGNSEIHYDLLSNGEKEIFNIIINLLNRRHLYQNTIYFMDELDLHLNTQLQYNLLKEITENWIPENCQLWTASHSLGFIEYANESEIATILDFDDLDFDVPQILYPQPKNNFEVFEIAVSPAFMNKVFEGRRIIFAENTDTHFYNDLQVKNTYFFNAIDKKDVFFKSKNLNYFGLIDRDYLTDNDIEQIKIQYPNLIILNYYSIENYFYHPDNLAEYYKKNKKTFDKEAYEEKIREIKNINRDTILYGIDLARRGYPFFNENKLEKQKQIFLENGKTIVELFRSDVFEEFYKVFPSKDYGKTLAERQNLNKVELAQTKWFKSKILEIVK